MKKILFDIRFRVHYHLKNIYYFLIDFPVLFRKGRFESKVFCIGFHKTGTTSLGKSFELLGYKNASFRPFVFNYYKNNKIDKLLQYASKYDSFDDLPWFKEDLIPILDEKFPNSHFVYLKREEQEWKNSYYNWFVKAFNHHPDVDVEWKKYKEHEAFVLNYFKNSPPHKFIILEINDSIGFKKLADFLGKQTDRKAFPHYHKT